MSGKVTITRRERVIARIAIEMPGVQVRFVNKRFEDGFRYTYVANVPDYTYLSLSKAMDMAKNSLASIYPSSYLRFHPLILHTGKLGISNPPTIYFEVAGTSNHDSNRMEI